VARNGPGHLGRLRPELLSQHGARPPEQATGTVDGGDDAGSYGLGPRRAPASHRYQLETLSPDAYYLP